MNLRDDHFLDSLLNIHISTAAKYDQTVQEAPASVAVVTSDDIQRFGYRTVLEALMSVTGLYTRNDRNYTYLGVRGFSRPGDYNDRIILLLDGHMMNESYFGAAPLDEELGITMASIDCIEVVRGPGSVLYGTGAVFAVVNIITKKGNVIDGADIAVEGGSFERYEGSVVLGKKSDYGVEYSVSAIWGKSKGEDAYYPEFYHPPDLYGISKNLDWEKYNGIQYSFSYKTLAFSGSVSSRKKGIPTASYGTTFNDSRAQTLDEHMFAELRYQQDVSRSQNIIVRGYFDSYYCDGDYPYSTLLNAAQAHAYTAGSEVRFRWDLSAGNRLILGAEYRNSFRANYQSMNDGIIYSETDFPFWTISGYFQDELQLFENLMLTFGVRGDKNSMIGNTVNPRVSFVYTPFHSSTLKLLYGEAYRAPNVYEMNFEDFEASLVASHNLSTENIRTYEIVWEQRFYPQLLGTFSLFNYDMFNLIESIQDSLLWQFKNVTHIHSIGLENSFIFSLNSHMRGYCNYSFQYTRDVTNSQKLTNSPNHIAQCGIGFPVYREISAGVECRYESKRMTVYQISTDPFFLTNLNVSVQTPSQRMRGSLQIRNIFNTTYQTPGGIEHVQPAITQDRRTYTIRLEYTL